MLKSDGVEKGANNMWVFGSTWLQAEPGSNVFRYDAESGVDNLMLLCPARRYSGGVAYGTVCLPRKRRIYRNH